MLSPRPAEAAPVVAFVGGALGVGASTALAATAAYASGAAFAGTLVGGFVVRTVVAIGLSALAAKLAPSPAAANASPIERMVNFAQPVSYAEWVYGRTRKGGPVGFTGFANDKRWYVPILAAHPIKGVVQHRLDERIVSLTDAADTNASNISENPIAGYGRVDVFTGDPGQAVHAGLDAAFAEITSEFDFEGLAGAVIWAARPPNETYTQVFPGGRQWQYSPVLDGKKDLYDPRDGQYKFSANAALVFADWCVNVMGRQVDWDEIADEADACDLVEPDAAGIPRKRWELNGTLSDEQDYETHRAQLATACDAFVYDRTDGKVGFTVGRWLEPELTLGPDDFLSFELTEGQYGADAPDEVAALYTEPDNGWRETPSGAWVARIAAKPVTDQPQIFMVTNHFQAARLNKRLARSKHAQYQLRGTIGMKGYEILGGRSGGVRIGLCALCILNWGWIFILRLGRWRAKASGCSRSLPIQCSRMTLHLRRQRSLHARHMRRLKGKPACRSRQASTSRPRAMARPRLSGTRKARLTFRISVIDGSQYFPSGRRAQWGVSKQRSMCQIWRLAKTMRCKSETGPTGLVSQIGRPRKHLQHR